MHAEFFDDDDSARETDQYLLNMILSLYGSKGLALKHCTEVVRYLEDITKKTVELCIKRIAKSVNIEEAKQALQQAPIIDFSDYMTQYKFEKKLQKMSLLKKPSKFTIAHDVVETIPGELKNVKHLGVIMDIEFQVTKFLEIEGFLDCILKYQTYLQNTPTGVYKNYMNGNSWKRIAAKYQGKTLIPLFLYNDDFQVRLI